MRRFDSRRAAYFDELSKTWDATTALPEEKHVERLLTVLAIKPQEIVMDVGSGTGFLLRYLLQQQPAQVIACDLSTKMLEIAAAKHEGLCGLCFLCADASDLPLDDASVDVIACNGVYPHFADADGTLRELFRVAKPRARIAISHFRNRDFINAIHGSSSDLLIRQDLLEPAEQVAQRLQRAGFAVSQVCDTDEFYLVGGKKADD